MDHNVSNNQSQWHLTAQQLQHFDQQGYVLLSNRIPNPLLNQLRHQVDAAQLLAHNALKKNQQSSDMVITTTLFQTFLNRLLHFHLHAGIESLSVLGCPQLLAPIESLCGSDFVATIDMVVIKHQQNDTQIPWHQDLIYQSSQYRIATAGVYLDDSTKGEDALKLIERTAIGKQNICAIQDSPPTGVIEVPAKAGDILIHNPMMVHSSGNITRQSIRRTLYYEFRPLQQVKTSHLWHQTLLNQRLNLVNTAQAIYSKTHPYSDHFKLSQNEHAVGLQKIQDLSALYSAPVPFNTANFCQQ